MTMLEYLEEDRDKMLVRLQSADTQEKAAALVNDELDRLLLLYNENCEIADRREAAAWMVQTAKGSCRFINTIGEVHVYEETDYGNAAEQHMPHMPLLSVICLILAAVSGAGAFVLALMAAPGNYRATDLILAVILAAAAPAFGWLGGKIKGETGSRGKGKNEAGHSRSHKNSYSGHIVISPDPEKIMTCLQNMICAVDQNLTQILPADRFSDGADESDIITGTGHTGFKSLPSETLPSESELALFANLLEAAYSGDGTYALEKIMEVKYYLHRNHIETSDYNGSNEEMFDFLPSGLTGRNGSNKNAVNKNAENKNAENKNAANKNAENRVPVYKTIRPAFVLNGQVIRRGMAVR